ncbi:MAG: carboxypeptidase regulatory-like domain-containing protein [Candidatus Micrarchaeia archaeon]
MAVLNKIAVLLLFFAGLACAVPLPPDSDARVTLLVLDAASTAPLAGAFTLRARSPADSFVQPLISNESGEALLYLPAGIYSLELLSDYPETPGVDAFGRATVNSPEESFATVFLEPAASVYGRIRDAEGRAVSGARVSVDCVNSFYSVPDATSDETGNYFIEFVPAGSCVFTALSDGFRDSRQLLLAAGSFEGADFALTTSMHERDYSLFYALAAALTIVLLYLAYNKFKRVAPPVQTKQARPKKTGSLPAPRLKPEAELSLALKSLAGREKQVVEWLLANNGNGKQSALQRELLLPKASLSRAVKSLERKGLVRCTRLGKANSMRLSERFYAD